MCDVLKLELSEYRRAGQLSVRPPGCNTGKYASFWLSCARQGNSSNKTASNAAEMDKCCGSPMDVRRGRWEAALPQLCRAWRCDACQLAAVLQELPSPQESHSCARGFSASNAQKQAGNEHLGVQSPSCSPHPAQPCISSAILKPGQQNKKTRKRCALHARKGGGGARGRRGGEKAAHYRGNAYLLLAVLLTACMNR